MNPRKIQTKKANDLPLDINFTEGQLLFDKVLVKQVDVQISKDGLATSSQYEDKPEFGKVIMVGTGILLESGELVPLPFNKGDIVFFEKYSAKKVRIKGEDYLIIRSDDIDWYQPITK